MKSFRLHGFQRLILRLLIQVDAINNGQRMTQLQADQNPILQGGAQINFAFLQRRAESDNTRA